MKDSFIQTAENLDKCIVKYGTRMLQSHINGGENDIVPITDLYFASIFNSMQIIGHAHLYKTFNNVAVWLITGITDELYLESIDDYLKTNTTSHGILVYESYLKNKDYFQNEYFGPERSKVVDAQGLLFILTEKGKDDEILKKCFFHPISF